MENQELDWGKCKVVVDKNGQRGKATTIEDIVEGSTQLNTEQGQKTEAVIEGGEVIATRYQRNKYSLTFQEFGQPSIENIDGIVAGYHDVTLVNCDSGVDKEVFTITAVINVQPGFSSEYGTVTNYTCDAVRQEDGSIKWATAAVETKE